MGKFTKTLLEKYVQESLAKYCPSAFKNEHTYSSSCLRFCETKKMKLAIHKLNKKEAKEIRERAKTHFLEYAVTPFWIKFVFGTVLILLSLGLLKEKKTLEKFCAQA